MIKPILLCFISLFSFVAHPIHLGVTEIDYNEDSRSFEISHKFFIDDFEQAVNKKYGIKLNLGADDELHDADDYIQKYLNESFFFELDAIPQEPLFIGKESDLEAVWIYREITSAGDMKRLSFSCNSLMEVFEDQKQMVHLKYMGGKQSTMLDKDEKEGAFDF